MDKKSFFSIIIPSYNCAGKLARALESVNKQSYKNFEVIVCDSSTDHTKQVVDSYTSKLDIKYLWGESCGGPARARNSGLRIAKGDYVAFLDSDDWWYPCKLEYVTRYLDKGDIVYHDLDIYTEQGKNFFKKIKGRHLKKPIFIDLMKNINPLFTSSVVVKKSIIDKAGGFIEENTLEDFDLWLKISRITDKFIYIPKCLGVYWISKGSRSDTSEKMLVMLKSVYHRNFVFLPEDDKKEAEKLLSYFLGRTKQRMGLTKEALELFKTSRKSKNMKFKFRSICWIIFINIFTKLSTKLPRE